MSYQLLIFATNHISTIPDKNYRINIHKTHNHSVAGGNYIYIMFRFYCEIVGAGRCICQKNMDFRICRGKNFITICANIFIQIRANTQVRPYNTPRLSSIATPLQEGINTQFASGSHPSVRGGIFTFKSRNSIYRYASSENAPND